ncbi:helix-turn-helix domain-containing protein [Oleidesulfovibrio alaskensis]|jgi:transposase
MRHDDGRKLDHKTLEAIRVRAVQRVMDGESPEVVIKALGMSRARIYEWLAAYREGVGCPSNKLDTHLVAERVTGGVHE